MRWTNGLFAVAAGSTMSIALSLGGLYAPPSTSLQSIISNIRVADIACSEETKFIGDKNDYCAADEKLCDRRTITVTLTSLDYDDMGTTKSYGLEVWPGGSATKGKLTMDYSDFPDGCKSITNYQGPCSKKAGKQFTTSIDGGAKAFLEITNCADFVFTGPCAAIPIFSVNVHIPEGELDQAIKLGLPMTEGGYTCVVGEFSDCLLDSTRQSSVRCDGGGNTTMLITPTGTCPGDV